MNNEEWKNYPFEHSVELERPESDRLINVLRMYDGIRGQWVCCAWHYHDENKDKKNLARAILLARKTCYEKISEDARVVTKEY